MGQHISGGLSPAFKTDVNGAAHGTAGLLELSDTFDFKTLGNGLVQYFFRFLHIRSLNLQTYRGQVPNRVSTCQEAFDASRLNTAFHCCPVQLVAACCKCL